MEPARFKPRVQIFVCANARAPDDPLASACGTAGPGVCGAIKRAVGAAGRVRDVWVTRTGCLGHCPPKGCSVALYPENEQFVNVTEGDAAAIVAAALGHARDVTPR